MLLLHMMLEMANHGETLVAVLLRTRVTLKLFDDVGNRSAREEQAVIVVAHSAVIVALHALPLRIRYVGRSRRAQVRL